MRQIRVVSPELKQRQVIRRPTPYVRARRRYWRRLSAVVLPNVILALIPDTHQDWKPLTQGHRFMLISYSAGCGSTV